MRIDTRNYEMAHGKKPRGEQRWIFVFFGPNGRAEYGQWGTYGEAAKWAQEKAKEIGATVIQVADWN